MPLYTHNKFALSRLKKLSAAVTLALALPMAANAAGLGKLTVLSSLGQPLRAEIELNSVSKEEEGALVARLAPADAFKKANIDFNPVLSSLRFSVEQRQGKQLIRISSSQAINEPFVDLLLELSGGGSRLVREYTFLLDPPDMRKPQTPQSAPATPPAAKPAASAPATAPAKPAAAPVAAAPAASAPAANATPTAAAINNSDEEPTSRIVTKSAPSSQAEELIRNGRSNDQSSLTNAPVPAAVAEKTVPAAPAKMDAKADDAAATPAVAASGKRGKGGKAASNAAQPDAKTEGKSYRVKEGDTLAEIANRTKDNTVSLDQMLVALYRANPDAFIGDNINRLRAGRVLSVPDAATANAVDKGEARTTVVAQAQDFNAYRNKLAGQVANGPSRKAGDSRQSSSGKVTARVEEKSGAGDAKDKLQLSKAGASDRAAAEKAAAEDKIAADKAIAEANERVKALEKNVSDLQKLLEIKNKTLAEMSEQQKAAAAKPETPAQPTPAPAAAVKPEEKPAEAKPAEVAAEQPKPETPAPAPAAPAPAAAPAAVAPKVAAAPVPAVKANFFDNIQDNPFVLPGAGALVALLAAWGIVRVRNNRKKAATAASADADKEDEPGKVTKQPEPTPEAAAVAEPETAPEVVAETAPETVAATAAVAAASEPDAVDPISEADMYISYGREEQAEDILRLALKSDPNRQAIRLKLLEIYSKRQDVEGFNDVARELHDATGGIGSEWEQAAAMGIVLDPTNPLYGGSPVEEVVAEEAPVVEKMPEPEPEPPAPEEQDLEFDLNDFKGAEIQPGATPVTDIGSKIDFDLELDSGKSDAEDAASLLDDLPKPSPVVNNIDLDLPEPVEAPKQDVLEDDESAFAAEMSTKLDLAAAYQEIGDKEGARELLDEVIRGGSDAQIARAKEMLSKLS